MNLTKNAKFTRVMNAVAAGQAATNSTALDMYGYSAVTFIALVGDIAGSGTATLKAQQSDDNGVVDAFSDLLGTSIAWTDADDNKVGILEINEPQKRYVRCVLETATSNGVKDGVVALQTKSALGPVTQGSTVVAAELHHAPEEGTA